MKSLATAEFWRLYARLPQAQRRDARKAYRLWQRNPLHGLLHFKKAGKVWSVRVGRGYRAIGLLKGDTMHWFWIGPHDEYERILRRR
jgi:hypothetical protein